MMARVTLSGRHATIIHRADRHRDALVLQIARIGLDTLCLEPGMRLAERTDVVLFDAEHGEDGLLPWATGQPPVPLIAIIGSEAPSRIEWALDQAASSFLRKPFGSSGAHTALLAAWRLHAERTTLRARAEELAERVRARPLVVRAVLEIMSRHRLGEAAALAALRRVAMARRLSIEAAAADIAANPRLAAAWFADADPARLPLRLATARKDTA